MREHAASAPSRHERAFRTYVGDVAPCPAQERIVFLALQWLAETELHRHLRSPDLWIGLLCHFAALALECQALRKPTRHNIEHRRKDQAERRNANHARENRSAKCLPKLRARADSPDQRRHPEDEGKGRHKNWPQPQMRRPQRRRPTYCGHHLQAALQTRQ